MPINTNSWNRIRYTLYTPVYNKIAGYFSNSRKISIESLNLQKGDKILIVGAGTGLDLEFIPIDCDVVATDITPSMIKEIKRCYPNRNIQAMVMDGQSLHFADQTFDKIILHLILAVIPDPIACIKESERVLKINGQIAVFDKFVHKNKELSLLRRVTNIFTNFLFSDITRHFETIISHTQLTVDTDIKADLGGNFRRIHLTKKSPNQKDAF